MDNVYHDAEKGLIIPVVAAVFNDGYNKVSRSKLGVSCEILRSRYPPSPRLWRVLLASIPAASYGEFGEGE